MDQIRPQPKKKREVSLSRLKWCRRQPCILMDHVSVTDRISVAHACTGPLDAHHVTAKGAGGSDFDTLPLCRMAHTAYHNKGRNSFERYYSLDLEALLAEHNARFRAEVKPRKRETPKRTALNITPLKAKCSCGLWHKVRRPSMTFVCTKNRKMQGI